VWTQSQPNSVNVKITGETKSRGGLEREDQAWADNRKVRGRERSSKIARGRLEKN